MDEATKVRKLQEQRESIRREIAGIRRTLRKFEGEFSEHCKGWMPEALLDWLEAEVSRSPEDAE